MNQKQIQKRRETVSFLLLKNKTETEIADILGVSRSTTVRDVSTLKQLSQNWLDGLAKDGGFTFEYKLGLEKMKLHGKELVQLYEKSKKIYEKLQILRALDENTKIFLELLSEYPTISALKKAINSD